MAQYTFNFTEAGWSPTSPYSFNFTKYINYVRNIWTDENYVYAATSDSLKIFDLDSGEQYAYITIAGGLNSVWASEDYVYLGTVYSGVKYITKTCISGTNLITCLADYSAPPDLTANEVRYIHGHAHGDGDFLVVCTASGVDTFGPEPYYHRHSYITTTAQKCFMTSNLEFYYTTVSSINRINRPFYNWVIPDESYTPGPDIRDIFVTVETSVSGSANTIFVATSSGVYVIDEGIDEIDIYYSSGN